MSTPSTELVTLEEALADYLSPFGYSVTRTGTDLQERIKANGAVINVRRIGGQSQRWQLVARIGIEVFAATYSTLWQRATDVDQALLASPYRTSGWLIDRCVNESALAPQAYADPAVRLLAAAYRVTTRTRP